MAPLKEPSETLRRSLKGALKGSLRGALKGSFEGLGLWLRAQGLGSGV